MQHSASLKSRITITKTIFKVLFAVLIIANLNSCAKGYGCYTSAESIEINNPVQIVPVIDVTDAHQMNISK